VGPPSVMFSPHQFRTCSGLTLFYVPVRFIRIPPNPKMLVWARVVTPCAVVLTNCLRRPPSLLREQLNKCCYLDRKGLLGLWAPPFYAPRWGLYSSFFLDPTRQRVIFSHRGSPPRVPSLRVFPGSGRSEIPPLSGLSFPSFHRSSLDALTRNIFHIAPAQLLFTIRPPDLYPAPSSHVIAPFTVCWGTPPPASPNDQ